MISLTCGIKKNKSREQKKSALEIREETQAVEHLHVWNSRLYPWHWRVFKASQGQGPNLWAPKWLLLPCLKSNVWKRTPKWIWLHKWLVSQWKTERKRKLLDQRLVDPIAESCILHYYYVTLWSLTQAPALIPIPFQLCSLAYLLDRRPASLLPLPGLQCPLAHLLWVPSLCLTFK